MTTSRDRIRHVTPLIRTSFEALASVIATANPVEVLAALQRMATDPTELLTCENVGPRAWTTYEAGGPLAAERIELIVAPELTFLTVEQLVAMLGRLAGDEGRILPTSQPWRMTVRVLGMPRVSLEILPALDVAEDLVIRIVLGAGTSRNLVLAPGTVERLWKQQTIVAQRRWLAFNQARPLAEHPAFEEMVELGVPGVYLIRSPPVPYSPLLPIDNYQSPVAWAVFETTEELEACQAYYRQPGASFFHEPPLFRNRPPCSSQLARPSGGVSVSQVRVIRTPWGKTVSVCTLPDDLLQERPQLRQKIYRGRYLINGTDDGETVGAVCYKTSQEWRQAH